MVYEFHVLDDRLSNLVEYKLKRSEGGHWELKMTDTCYDNELKRVRADVERFRLLIDARRLKELEAGNKWHPMNEGMAPALETAYQRYVRNA